MASVATVEFSTVWRLERVATARPGIPLREVLDKAMDDGLAKPVKAGLFAANLRADLHVIPRANHHSFVGCERQRVQNHRLEGLARLVAEDHGKLSLEALGKTIWGT